MRLGRSGSTWGEGIKIYVNPSKIKWKFFYWKVLDIRQSSPLPEGSQTSPALSFCYEQGVDEDEYGTLVEWFWQGKAEVLWANPVPLPLCPPWYLSRTDPGSNPGLRGESNLNYVFFKIWFVPHCKHSSRLSRSASQCCTTGSRSVGLLCLIIGAWSGGLLIPHLAAVPLGKSLGFHYGRSVMGPMVGLDVYGEG